MGKIFSIASTTFRDCTRDTVFYVTLLAFTALLFVSGWTTFFGMGREAIMVREMGLATIAMGGLFLILIVGTGTVASEFRSGTLQTVMSKPAGRNQLVIGKFFGIIAHLALATAFLTAMFLCMLWLREGHFPFLRAASVSGEEAFGIRAVKAAFLIFLELSLVASFALFVTLLTSRPAAAVISFAAFTLGHLSGGAAAWLRANAGLPGKVASALLPRLEFFRVTQAAVEGRPQIRLDYLALGAVYAASGAAIFLLAAMMVFKRREIR
jgi:ABC-type transport system involved in multi-copper enzyme maturation permease subunit